MMTYQKCKCLISDPKTGELTGCEKNVYSSMACPHCSVLCSVCRQEPAHPELKVCKECIDKIYTKSITNKDYDDLVTLSKRLLTAANMLMEKENIIQPFFGIVKDCAEIIYKLDLFESEKKEL